MLATVLVIAGLVALVWLIARAGREPNRPGESAPERNDVPPGAF
jgi:hypothetical protein